MLKQKKHQESVFALRTAVQKFKDETYLVPFIGVELEFYLLDANFKGAEIDVDAFISDFVDGFSDRNFFYQLERERGRSQFELKFRHGGDVFSLCREITEAKFFASDLAEKFGCDASFAAQPIVDDCGSALQVNISLHDEEGRFSDAVCDFAIAGLLENLDEKISIYAPSPEDLLRFDLVRNVNLHKNGKFTAPVNKSFGVNNRSCAIRLLKGKRIEFRVPSANSDPFLVMAAVIDSISDGLRRGLTPGEGVYGNAFDYDLEGLF